jgi:uncharacterized protein YbbC (DUF1343 family)
VRARGAQRHQREEAAQVNRQALLLGIVCAANVAAAQAPRVRPGIDVLLADSARLITGKRVGLITNQTGIDAHGVSTIDRLMRFPATRLVALFAPEHGIRGTAAPGERVNDTVDVATGLPIYSLHGGRARPPSPAQLALIDVLLVDLQDVGARPFTYSLTVVLAMRAAAAAHVRVVVLDRPNPVGCRVQGPVLDTVYASPVGILPVPLRHGMTIGELARFANGELHIGADLVVVPVRGWRRCRWFDETDLPWVRPSPNLPDLESVAWYPGTVLFEGEGLTVGTNLSVGRGSDAPFRQVGAPWLDAARIAAEMRRRYGTHLDTVTFTPRAPGDRKYDGVAVHAVRFGRFERARGDAIRDAIHLLGLIAELHGDSLRVDSLLMARHLGVRPSPRTDWAVVIRTFARRRAPYLLYR